MKTMQNLCWLRACPLLVILLTVSAPRAELGKINLIMTATLVSNACTVSTDSKYKTVNMGRWAAKQFSVNRQSLPPVPFTINLENCGPAASGVSVTFNGVPDSEDPSLLSISGPGAAKNVGIAILDHQKNRIPLRDASNIYMVHPNDSVALNFYGQYVATATPVTPGTANAEATFSLSYQ
ncbi:fimbrial-like adhesin protein SfmF [Serratia ficaria]|uniref:fimbrial protein n=1 Tax=Serratia ficaria TaxID=61651 RepID=UPI00218277F7|nr:fimbrial protein [Serratia ficaria]CAI2534535.1 fimbrial-like adhesin protein SfmF [Serratia ficaria]